ncbi:hypothetical protein KEM55_003424 [Ascosphaera atra]|nr:hypothetical protein KEM55_003424 [Ascosphaera atra]
MKEYWNDPEKTAEVMVPDDDGNVWMHTGDEASMSDDGYLTITGRIKDLIIRGGENIHPLEIENCLHAHENVSDVSVIGVPDERYGEAIAAFVVPRSGAGVARDAVTEESIKDWVSKRLSRFLVPKYVFFLTDSNAFPKTGSGKVQKYLLKERALDILRRKP